MPSYVSQLLLPSRFPTPRPLHVPETEGDFILLAQGLDDLASPSHVLHTALTGLALSNAAITASDNVLQAMGKIQAQIDTKYTAPISSTAYYLRGNGTPALLNTAVVPEGIENVYYTNARGIGSLLTGLATAQGGNVLATDSILQAVGKLENRTALNDAKVSYPGLPTFGQLGEKPTTLSGYGITDATTAPLTGLSLETGGAVVATDTILQALGKVQVQLNSNFAAPSGLTTQYIRGNGSLAILDSSAVTENTNLYFTSARAVAAPLTGLSLETGGAVVATDTVLQALGKVQVQLNANFATPSGLTSQYVRGNGSLAALDTSAVSENTNLYFTSARAIGAALTGLSTATGTTVAATDTVLQAIGKLENRTATNDAKVSYPGLPTFSQVAEKPTTLAGYGITDAASVAKPDGFLALFKTWPNASTFVSATAAAMAAHTWMRGARFYTTGVENIAPSSTPSGSAWNTDIAAIGSYRPPLSMWMTRFSSTPSKANYDISVAATLTDMDAVVAGMVALATAAGTKDYMFDPENYAGSDISLLFNYARIIAAGSFVATTVYTIATTGSTDFTLIGAANSNPGTVFTASGVGAGNGTAFVGTTGLKNSGLITRAAMCTLVEELGRQFGLSLWERVPDARLHLLFGASQVIAWAGTPSGTAMPASMPDNGTSGYAINPYYNMLPYFCRGLLDACPSSGRIIDYVESSYGFAGLAALQRNLYGSKNWVSLFFPGDTGLIAKSVNQWIPVPILYANCYFTALGTWYAGANFVTTLADQQTKFTRDALYALQLTPPGYLPAVYTDSGNPWGQGGAVTNMNADWQVCLNNALSIFKGDIAINFDRKAFGGTLKTLFAARADYVKECL